MNSASIAWLYRRDEHTTGLDTLRMMCEDDFNRRATDDELAYWIGDHGWEAITECGLCERPLEEGNTLGLCDTCAQTCQAHARHEQERSEWEEEGRP